MSRISRLAIGLLAAASGVAACGESESSTVPAAHPALECTGEGSGTGNYDLTGPGFDTTKAALKDRLAYFQGLYGGEVVELTDTEAALQVDGSNVVVATATPTAEGGFLVQEDYSCDSFGPQVNGPPVTAPLVTPDP